jgi:murein DD-endopeptidase MepM/ murein hydrolase activator NlpD
MKIKSQGPKYLLWLSLWMLCLQGALAQGEPSRSLPFLAFPIEGRLGEDYILPFYVDWGLESDVLDHACGNKTYDGHQGTDFLIRSFAAMDEGVTVLAAEAGEVIALVDSLFDREKTVDPSRGFGNYIALKHLNGYYTYYAHLAQNSALVAVGDLVEQGQPIASVGSSGNSSDPHLHFELWWDSLQWVDPFGGTCGNALSLWLEELPYDTSFAVWTSGLTHLFPELDVLREEPTRRFSFHGEDEYIAYWSILYGVRKGDVFRIEWFDPEGFLWFSFDYEALDDAWYFYYWSYIDMPPTEKGGDWLVKVSRNGLVMDEIGFVVETQSANHPHQRGLQFSISPNPSSALTRIEWDVNLQEPMGLDLLDSSGNRLRSLWEESTPLGAKALGFDSSALAPGLYFIQMTCGQNVVRKKFWVF